MTSHRTRLRLVERLRQNGIRDESVLQAMLEVPRHCFVDEALASRSYEDCSLPIGEGQTISQPYVVALMTELVVNCGQFDKPVERVLEIGTGSGYQAAVLASLVPKVFTLERIRSLSHRATRTFSSLGIRNVKSRYADGFDGWQDQGPFDAVIVTAAMDDIPDTLLAQVRNGGALIGPVGPHGAGQSLSVARCHDDKPPRIRQVADVKFVPFLRGLG